MSKINIRSPYYINLSDAFISSAVLDLYIYTGSSVSTMNEVMYSIETDAYNGTVSFEISQLIDDYIDVTFDGGFDSIVVWLNYQVTKTIANGTPNTPETPITLSVFDGYGYFEDGSNPQLSDRVLQSNDTIYTYDNNIFHLPIQQDELARVDLYSTAKPSKQYYGDKVIESTSASSEKHYIEGEYSKDSSSIDYTFSAYVKSSELTKISLRILGATGEQNARINFDTATEILDSGGASSGVYIDSGFSDVGNGWYRVYLTATSNTDSSIRVQVLLYNGTANSYIGDGVSGLYVRGLQLVEGLSPLPYNETVSSTNTNLLLYSESISNAYWNKNFTTILEDDIIIPKEDKILVDTQTFTPTTDSGDVIRYVSYTNPKKCLSVVNYLFEDRNNYLFQDVNNYIFDDAGFVDAIKITYTDASTETIKVKTISENKHTPYRLTFVNKFGALQSVWMFKRSDVSMSVENENYRGFLYNGSSYSVSEHQYKNYNVTARETISLNSGFYTEDYNEVFKQLLLSERVWIDYKDQILPVNIKSKELAFKTQVNDKLIDYKIDFEFAFDKINNVF